MLLSDKTAVAVAGNQRWTAGVCTSSDARTVVVAVVLGSGLGERLE